MITKVAFIISGLRGGGTENVCVNLSRALADRGKEVDLVVLNLDKEKLLNQVPLNVNIVNLNVKHARYSVFYILKYLLRRRPKVILSFNRQISVVLSLIRLLTTIKFKLISRNSIYLSVADSYKKGFWHRFVVTFLIKKFYGLSDILVAQSIGMKSDLIRYLDITEKKVVVINNPIKKTIEETVSDIDFLNMYKKDYLLCVGRLEEQKAFHFAIQAFAKIADKFPELRLKIVGQGSLEDNLKGEALSLGIVEKVDFEGFQSNIIPYYLHAQATLLTSLYEGFPNVLVESITLGTPVVAFDCESGPREIIQDGINGYLVSYLDVDEFSRALKKLLIHKLDCVAVNKTSQKYKIDNILNSYVNLLKA